MRRWRTDAFTRRGFSAAALSQARDGRADHVGPGTGIARDAEFDFQGPDGGFGLGFSVRDVAKPPLPAGEYRWDGVGGTFFFIDPADDMFAICMMQSPSQRGRIQTELKRLIYEAMGR